MAGYISVKKANCKNCYKCLKYCNVKSIRYSNDQVEVIADQCILCGHCINVCPQKAKTVVNDPARVLSMLADPDTRVVASLAPSYAGIYGRDSARLVGALYALGFDRVEETAVGAREVTGEYRRLMDKGEMPCILTTCCPTVNLLIAQYYPALVPYMAPVVSPALAHGRMIKERFGAETKVVFIGPCLSKIREIDEHPESADAVLSFRKLDEILSERRIAVTEQGERLPEESPYSRIYPVPEGILRDVSFAIPDRTTTAIARDAAVPDEQTIRKILTEIGKPTPDKELNCGSCGYPTCRDKAIAVYQGKAELYMCLPYINDLSQSLSNVTLSVTPNYILAVDHELRILEINLPAQKLFGVSRQQAVKGDLFEYMDPSDFEEVFETHRNIVDKKVRLEGQGRIVMSTLVYVPEQDLVVGVMKDVTEEEAKKESAFKARLESAEMAQKVIEKQMIAAQEIASLLGETTAETKTTLNTLKNLILSEGTET